MKRYEFRNLINKFGQRYNISENILFDIEKLNKASGIPGLTVTDKEVKIEDITPRPEFNINLTINRETLTMTGYTRYNNFDHEVNEQHEDIEDLRSDDYFVDAIHMLTSTLCHEFVIEKDDFDGIVHALMFCYVDFIVQSDITGKDIDGHLLDQYIDDQIECCL